MGDLSGFIERLAERINGAWRAVHFDELQFADVACRALTELPPSEHLRPQEIIDWVLKTPEFPAQMSPDSAFGNPPVQLFVGERFYIEALFWVDGTTNVHDHGFSGAFHVLAGSSLHSLYEFQTEQRFNHELEVGRLTWKKSELLARGDTRPILYGRQMIHSLFHLDRPSVTIVARTFRDRTMQLSYFPPGVAHAPLRNLQHTLVQARCLEFLQNTEPAAFGTAAANFFAACDYSAALYALLHFSVARMNGDAIAAAVAIMRQRDDRVGALFERAIYEINRTRELTLWRQQVSDAEQRFALALLLNLPNRKAVLAAIAARYPGAAPAKQMCLWLKHITTAAPGLMPGLSISDFFALEAELSGVPSEQVSGDIAARRIEHLKTIRALNPLFVS